MTAPLTTPAAVDPAFDARPRSSDTAAGSRDWPPTDAPAGDRTLPPADTGAASRGRPGTDIPAGIRRGRPPALPRRGRDAAVLGLAERQHGVVVRDQLLRAGVPAHTIDNRVKQGALLPLYRGVYRIEGLRSRLEAEMAAVLACGPAAVLSHPSAAGLWELSGDVGGGTPSIHVSAPRAVRGPGPPVRVHRVMPFADDETTTFEGVPITAPARTILDMAGSLVLRELEQALARAERRGLSTCSEVAALLARHPHRRGARRLRALLGVVGRLAFTRSEAESRFLALVRRAELPPPRVNARVEGFEVDFVWIGARLVVEIDGAAYHASASAFERDRRRDAALAGAGFRVMRITWRTLEREPEAMLVRLARALFRN